MSGFTIPAPQDVSGATTPARQDEENLVTLAHVRETAPGEAPGPREAVAGDNILSAERAKLHRQWARRLKSINGGIARLNRDKSNLYQAIREAGENPGTLAWVMNRLEKSPEDLERELARDAERMALWDVLKDLRDAPEEPAAAGDEPQEQGDA